MAGACGSCTACCKAYAIPEIEKPAGAWCSHCTVGVGCRIYEARPVRCSAFACVWLQSQSQPGVEMIEALRPDRCKVVFAPSTNPSIMTAIELRKGAAGVGVAGAFVDLLVSKGLGVAVGAPGSLRQEVRAQEHGVPRSREVILSEPDENGMSWST